jgi:DHA2 family methylenomycin A resistance protein-like MFS transporter
MLLGSVEKPRSGVLDSTRQTGSVLGVALFGSLVAGRDSFVFGLHVALIISAALLLIAAATIFARARRSA